MGSKLLVSATGPVRRVALVEDGVTRDVILEPRRGRRLVGNIHLGRVVRVLPGMQSAFVEIGLKRTAFLYAGDLPEDAEAPTAPINERIREGESLLVQVAKEPLGTKGARITSNITLPGRFLVYMPTVKHVGVSRRIEDEEERERLRDLVEAMCPEQGGLIVRTVGEGCDAADFEEDLEFLTTLWKDIETRVKTAKPPSLLHRDLDLSLMATRDLLTEDFDALVVDTREEFDRQREFLATFMPRCADKLTLDAEGPPLFTRHGVERELSRAMDRKVWLKSGGYIVVDQTEALTAVDVNTGRYVGKSSFEETVREINLQAVQEIAFQLRLRNIGGIIVIDFIDMAIVENRQTVHDQLVEALSRDKVRTRVLPMSALGLIEMTRKRVRSSLNQMMGQTCQICDGRGWTLSAAELARQLLERIRDTAQSHAGWTSLNVEAHPTVVDTLFEAYGDEVEDIMQRHGVTVDAHRRERMHLEHFEVKGVPS